MYKRNMTRFVSRKLLGNLKTVYCRKVENIRLLLQRQALNIGKVIWLPLTLWPRTLLCRCISSNAFSQTSLRKCFELIQIFKELETGYDIVLGFECCEISGFEHSYLNLACKYSTLHRSSACRLNAVFTG